MMSLVGDLGDMLCLSGSVISMLLLFIEWSDLCFWYFFHPFVDSHLCTHTKFCLHNTDSWFHRGSSFRIHTIYYVQLHVVSQALLFFNQCLSKHYDWQHAINASTNIMIDDTHYWTKYWIVCLYKKKIFSSWQDHWYSNTFSCSLRCLIIHWKINASREMHSINKKSFK